jgi:hypothetical protein
MADQQLAGQPAGAAAATADSYAAAFPGGITDAERRRLDLQTELYGRLSAWHPAVVQAAGRMEGPSHDRHHAQGGTSAAGRCARERDLHLIVRLQRR